MEWAVEIQITYHTKHLFSSKFDFLSLMLIIRPHDLPMHDATNENLSADNNPHKTEPLQSYKQRDLTNEFIPYLMPYASVFLPKLTSEINKAVQRLVI